MDNYIFKYKKELLELGAVEMDEVLLQLFQPEGQEVRLENGKGDNRTFSINWDEKLLYGKGIKGFFKGFKSDSLLITPSCDGSFTIHEFADIHKSYKAGNLITAESRERTIEVLSSMNQFQENNGDWLELYNYSRDYTAGGCADSLLCLPYLRDLEMYQYQIKTVKAVLNRFRGRALLCDEVGLGKTVEAGMAMLEYIMRGLVKKILVLVPPSLIDQWYYEMKRKFNQDFIKSDDPDFKGMGDEAWNHYDKVIASISTAKRKANSDIITGIQYDLVIVDEAHHLKNRKTQAWHFVNSLSKKYIFLLSATPVQNNMEELYNLITLLKPGQLKTYSYFKKNFVGDREGLEARNVNQLRKLLSSVMVRNRRSDVDVRFTKRTASTIIVQLTHEEQKLYAEISAFIKNRYLKDSPGLTRFVLKSLQEEMGSSFAVLYDTLGRVVENERLDIEERNAMHGFLVACGRILESCIPNPKLLQLKRIIDEFNGKMLVFTKYRATLEVIASFLRKQGIPVAVFHGGLRRKEKEEQIELFRQEASVLISTESGGEGRNLQFCNGMVNFDLPWNPMAIEQRIGRIHRVGQEKDVFVYNLAAKNTVENYILTLLDKKINMFELVVGEVDMIIGDIEDEAQFSDLIMDAWVKSESSEAMETEVDKLGEKLLENKRQYLKVKDLDENLFAGSLEADGEDS